MGWNKICNVYIGVCLEQLIDANAVNAKEWRGCDCTFPSQDFCHVSTPSGDQLGRVTGDNVTFKHRDDQGVYSDARWGSDRSPREHGTVDSFIQQQVSNNINEYSIEYFLFWNRLRFH